MVVTTPLITVTTGVVVMVTVDFLALLEDGYGAEVEATEEEVLVKAVNGQ